MAELKASIVLDNLSGLKSSLQKNFKNIFSTGTGASSGGEDKIGKENLNLKKKSNVFGLKSLAVLSGIGLGIFGLIKGFDSIIGLLKLVANYLNLFIAPFVPILINIMRPTFILLFRFLTKFLKILGITPNQDEQGNIIEPNILQKIISQLLKVAVVFTFFGVLVSKLSFGVLKLSTIFSSLGKIVLFLTKGIFSVLGVKILLIAGIFVAVGQVFKIFKEKILSFTQFFDNVLGTNFTSAVASFIQGFIDFSDGVIQLIKGIFTLDFSDVWDGLKLIIFSAWKVLGGVFLFMFQILKTILKVSWESLKKVFLTSFSFVKTLGQETYTFIKDSLKRGFSVLSGLGTFILNKVKSLLSFGSRGTSGRGRSVNDGVITPRGDIISTNPRDFLIATQKPQDLFNGANNGGGVKSLNFTINISAQLDNISGQLKEQIEKVLRETANRNMYKF